jgi:hypothetical protein
MIRKNEVLILRFAQIIFNSRVIYVPVSTVTIKDKLLTTSLTYDQIEGL